MTSDNDVLQNEIARRTAQGWEIVSRGANEVQMQRPKRFSFGWAIFWFLFFGVGVFVYLIWHWLKSEQLAFLRVVEGRLVVTERRGLLGTLLVPFAAYWRWAGERETTQGKVLAYGGPLVAVLAVVIIIAVASSGGGGEEGEPAAGTQETATVAAGASPASPAQETPEQPETPEATQPPEQDILNLSVGDKAKVGDAEVTVNSFRVDQGGEFLAPDPGNVWMVVDATVVNTGDDEYNISSLLQTAIRDADAREYDIAIGPELSGQLDGTIPPGDTLRGEAGFEVPAGAAGLQFVFKQAFGAEQARWKLE